MSSRNATLGLFVTAPKSSLEGILQLFYIHDPASTSFERPEHVPNYFRNAWPYFLIFLLLENLVLWFQKKPTARLNDSITSLSNGMFQECGRLLFRGAESTTYILIYENMRIVDLDWEAPSTWYLAVIGVDFCYYWVHRASHEVHLFWAQHQVHHSSEDFTLAVGLRQSVLQGWCSFIFYLPLALIVPPAHFIVHQQFNLIYQFWIHTRVVDSLGPLELVLNTPKHHRVHHGCNLYCIDKNYGGLLIIWDRIFGTFAEERKEPIVYGLVYNQPSFNPLYLQIFYNLNIIKKWRAMEGWKNKLSSVVKGPSWAPGSPWTGYHEDKIEIHTRDKFNVEIALWIDIYLTIHFILVIVGFQLLAQQYMALTPIHVLISVFYIIFSLTNIGVLFENRPFGPIIESLRLFGVLFLTFEYRILVNNLFLWIFRGFILMSLMIWLPNVKMNFTKAKTK